MNIITTKDEFFIKKKVFKQKENKQDKKIENELDELASFKLD